MRNFLTAIYYRATLQQPLITWLAITLLLGLSAYYAQDFRLDASADSLVLENDADLRYYRSIRARYGSDDFLVVTYTPKNDLFSDEVLDDLQALRDELQSLERIESVTSILDVPLIASPKVSLADIQERVRTLESPDTDRKLAREEFQQSPLYRDLLVSSQGQTTTLLVNFRRDQYYTALLQRRDLCRSASFTKN